jgi:NAD(P)-dependent dehydrogenase (short-subunit alcohol dehydrogenase family)
MTSLFSLNGRVAVVTGGGQGNGKAIAQGLAAAGAQVAVVDRSSDTASATASEINVLGGTARAFAADVSKEEDCAEAASLIKNGFGPVSILVNNAGILLRGGLDEATAREAWRRTFAVNVDGAFNMVQALKADLRETRGSIINVGSIVSFVAMPNSTAYTASKGAILQFTKALAVELASEGVRVNAIAPGFIETPMTETTRNNPERMQAMLAHTPMRRVGQPAELAGAVVFLASAAASFVTGVIIPIDGGYLAV